MSKVEEYINQEETAGALIKAQKEVAQGGGNRGKTIPESFGKKKDERNLKRSGKKVSPAQLRVAPQR